MAGICIPAIVPRKGLEPPHLAALAPETSASTNFATWAFSRLCRQQPAQTLFFRGLQK